MEMLVAMAVIAVFCSIIFPAVESARQAARSTESQNNLRQIALATQMYADSYNGVMPFHCGVGTMTELRQSATVGLFPYVSGHVSLFKSPGDVGSYEDSASLFDTFSSSYLFDCKTLSQYTVPERTVLMYNAERGAWQAEVVPGREQVVRTLAQLGSQKSKDRPGELSQQVLARDFEAPWQPRRFRFSPLRGLYTVIPFHKSHMNVVFAGGNVRSFTSQQEWEIFTGVRNESSFAMQPSGDPRLTASR